MTPLGIRLRSLRQEKGVTLSEMAAAIDVSSAYLSALEHGHRGKPTWMMLQRMVTYFNIIWDEAEELQHLAELSDPKITIDTAGLDAAATKCANVLAKFVRKLSAEDLEALAQEIEQRASNTN